MSSVAQIQYESVASTSYAEGAINITKPTGLAVGDVLFAFLFCQNTNTLPTPSGWSVVRNSTADFGPSDSNGAIFYKVADSGDVAASDFSFDVSDGTGSIGGTLVRVSGMDTSTVFEQVNTAANAGEVSPWNFTVSVTPSIEDSIIFAFCGLNYSTTMSGYSSTGSPTWTELTQLTGVVGNQFSVAYAPYPSTTEITNFQFDTGSAGAGTRAQVILFVARTRVDSAGTNALLDVSPTIFSQAGSAGTTGTNALHTASPEIFTQTGQATAPTQWVNEAKPSTSWTNEQI